MNEIVSTKQPKVASLVLQGKGGVGKTTVTVLLAALMEMYSIPAQAIDADGGRKLAKFFKASRNAAIPCFDIHASAEEIRQDPNLALAYWDPLLKLMSASHTLIDFGANADQAVIEWAAESGIGDILKDDGVQVHIYTPTTAEPAGIAGAIKVLKAGRELFPHANRTLVLNRQAGVFTEYEGKPEMAELERMKNEEGLSIVVLDKCIAEAWIAGEKDFVFPHDIAVLDAAEIARRFTGGDRAKANRSQRALARWTKEADERFGPLIKGDFRQLLNERVGVA